MDIKNQLKNHFNLPFEKEYLSFLEKQNGLFLYESGIYCEIPFDVDDGFISFVELFGLDLDNENQDLKTQNQELKGEIKSIKNPFFLGEDGGGNFYVQDMDNFKIYYWDRTLIHMDTNYTFKEEIGNLYFLCDGFERFLKLINKYTKGG